MKKLATVIGFACMIALAVGTVALTASPESDCDRAATIRKHVADAKKMPDEVKKELLRKADELCPKKGQEKPTKKPDVSGEVKKGEDLAAKGKLSEALDHFQVALSAEEKKTSDRVIEIARKLKKEGKVELARRFYEAGLSAQHDEKAYKEYQALPKKKAADLEAKGEGSLIKKETIVQSLLRRPDDRGDADDESISVEPRRRDRYDRDRYSRWDRDDRYSRWDRYDRYGYHHRRSCVDDEYAPKQSLPIQFESGSATLTPKARRQLDELGMAMESRDLEHVRRFYIDGHTDSLGSDEANCDLAFRRAESVIRYLADRWNIDPRRLRPRSFGESCPVAPNYDEEGRYLNRRVEVRNADMSRGHSRYSRARCH